MTEIIEGVLNVDSWPQVIVIIAGLCFLGYRQWLDSRKLNKVVDNASAAAEATAIVAHEVQPNSGKSLKDVAERTESNTADVLSAVQSVSDKLDAHLSVAVEESAILAQLKEKYLDTE